MSLKTITLKNMFGLTEDRGSEFKIDVPSESVGIINAAQKIYDYIFNYFSNTNNVDKFETALSKINTRELKVGEYSSFVSVTYGNEIVTSLLKINEETVKSVLENELISEDAQTIFSIFYLILFASCFEIKYDNIQSDNNCELYEEIPDSYGFKFKRNNTLFKFTNILDGNLDLKEFSFKKSGDTLREKGLQSLLTRGYYTSDEINYAVFDEKKDINSFINNIIQYDDVDGYYLVNKLGVYYSFYLYYGHSLYTKFIERIHDTLKSKAEETESQVGYNTGKTDYSIIFENQFELTGAVVNQEIFDCYRNIYDYASNLLKKYIDVLKQTYEDPKELRKEIFRNGGYVERLINKIVGASNGGSKYLFSQRTNIPIFDSAEDGKLIRDNILKHAQSSGQKLKNNNGYILVTKEKTLSNLRKNTTNNIVWEVCDSEDENEKMKITKIINRINTGAKFTDTSFYFYELNYFAEGNFNYNIENASKEKLEEKIDELCKISSSIIYKVCIFCLNDLKRVNNFGSIETQKYRPDQKTYIYYQSDSSTYKLVENNKISDYNADYNGTNYNNEIELYKVVGEDIIGYFNNLLNIEIKSSVNQEQANKVKESADSFESYVKSRLSSGYFTEKDYFYINDSTGQRIPVNPFVDIEFRVPVYNDDNAISIDWLPVTAMRSYKDNEMEDVAFNEKPYEIHAGTYFESMELNDNGGVKEIDLTLKSSNDMNLERIIYNSLSLDSKINSYSNKNSVIANIEKIIKDNASSNFRIRFGYRDIAQKDASNNSKVITSTNVSDSDFINRTKIKTAEGKNIVKPVMVYPWTYFKITGLNSNIKDGEDTYNIKGVSSGSYILNNMSLCGVPSSFSNTDTGDNSNNYIGTPRNVAGKLAKWIMLASADNKKDSQTEKDLTTARVCFLGDKKGTIISGVDDSSLHNAEKFSSDKYSYILKGSGTTRNDVTGNQEGVYLNGGNLESIEPYFFNEAKGEKTVLSAKIFNIKNDSKSISVKTILDNLVEWLPTRVYYIAKRQNQTVAVYLPYDSIYIMDDFFENYPSKTERITYQVIEADAYIYKTNEGIKSNLKDEDYHKTYFIRMYYEGPGRSVGENGEQKINDDYLRIYNYRSLQEQVIENLEISSGDSEFGNTISSVSLLGGGTPLIFTFSKDDGKMNENAVALSTKKEATKDIKKIPNATTIDQGRFSSIFEQYKDANPFFSINNSQYIVTDTKGTEHLPANMNTYTIEASRFFSDMQNKLYSGEMTILGDPFYYFDSSLEAGKYEIYLQMNRAEDQKTYKMIPSRYTGIYYIKGIKHNIDSSGKYTTTLSIFKRVFTGSDTSEKKN